MQKLQLNVDRCYNIHNKVKIHFIDNENKESNKSFRMVCI